MKQYLVFLVLHLVADVDSMFQVKNSHKYCVNVSVSVVRCSSSGGNLQLWVCGGWTLTKTTYLFETQLSSPAFSFNEIMNLSTNLIYNMHCTDLFQSLTKEK